MTAAEIIQELRKLSTLDRTQILEEAIRTLTAGERKAIERVLRRLQHPEVPESFWEGVEDHEEGRTVDMEIALRETPPRTS